MSINAAVAYSCQQETEKAGFEPALVLVGGGIQPQIVAVLTSTSCLVRLPVIEDRNGPFDNRSAQIVAQNT